MYTLYTHTHTGLDLMVGADIIETLIGNSDIFKVTKPSLNP
jgi:hypothetical protein